MFFNPSQTVDLIRCFLLNAAPLVLSLRTVSLLFSIIFSSVFQKESPSPQEYVFQNNRNIVDKAMEYLRRPEFFMPLPWIVVQIWLYLPLLTSCRGRLFSLYCKQTWPKINVYRCRNDKLIRVCFFVGNQENPKNYGIKTIQGREVAIRKIFEGVLSN